MFKHNQINLNLNIKDMYIIVHSSFYARSTPKSRVAKGAAARRRKDKEKGGGGRRRKEEGGERSGTDEQGRPRGLRRNGIS